MNNLLNNFNSIFHDSNIYVDDKNKKLKYIINMGEDNEATFNVILPKSGRPQKSNEILNNDSIFKNGYKVVQTANGEFTYIREKDNLLLPYRFDIASNFNEFGFAMVGKDAGVSWINQNFEYLAITGDFLPEEQINMAFRFLLWQEIKAFSKGNVPLSRVYAGNGYSDTFSYLDINGQIKEFFEYDNKNEEGIKTFKRGAEFNQEGFAFDKGDVKVLIATGYYIKIEKLFRLYRQKDLLDEIIDDTTELKEGKQLILRKAMDCINNQ